MSTIACQTPRAPRGEWVRRPTRHLREVSAFGRARAWHRCTRISREKLDSHWAPGKSDAPPDSACSLYMSTSQCRVLFAINNKLDRWPPRPEKPCEPQRQTCVPRGFSRHANAQPRSRGARSDRTSALRRSHPSRRRVLMSRPLRALLFFMTALPWHGHSASFLLAAVAAEESCAHGRVHRPRAYSSFL